MKTDLLNNAANLMENAAAKMLKDERTITINMGVNGRFQVSAEDMHRNLRKELCKQFEV